MISCIFYLCYPQCPKPTIDLLLTWPVLIFFGVLGPLGGLLLLKTGIVIPGAWEPHTLRQRSRFATPSACDRGPKPQKCPKWLGEDPCSVDFCRETPEFRFEFCRGFFGGFFPPIFSKEKGPKKSTKKSPAKFTRDFVRKNSPRISAEAFSWQSG